jgi:hypothetical protein
MKWKLHIHVQRCILHIILLVFGQRVVRYIAVFGFCNSMCRSLVMTMHEP